MPLPKFTNVAHSFHTELKNRINAYFEQNGKSTTGNYKLFAKAIILLLSFISLYVHLVFFTPAPVWAVLECLAFGGLIATIGFNVMHDGAHGSFSTSKMINHLAAFSLNVLGGSSFMWNMKHNIIHHAYTNVDGIDDDIDAKPFLRLCETQKFYKIHRFQHLYFWLTYSLLYLYWIFVSDYKKYFLQRIGPIPLKKMKLADHISFWGFKLLHLFLFVGLPIYVVGFEAWIIGFLVSGLFAGFVLSLVFQLAHTVEHTSFPIPDHISGKMEDEWAIHQLKTTSNFATKNKLVSWLVGGLNFQIEHHLFPKISHIHYPAISKIVRQACREYGIEYLEHRWVYQAVFSHVAFLRQMGR
ncbi:MAG: acyl-CoA desaturase [Bacteroidetes bacterium]|nr:acyl-CoA desaturase [Bacteroidota bacterium]